MTEFPTPVEVPGYVLERVIGQGATSVVWAGRDSHGQAVALKIPHPHADAVDRLQSATERNVLTALRHDHLVTLRAAVTLADGRVVSVFDRVNGTSLRATVDARGHLRPGEAVTVLTPICQAVAALHRAGALHGDISPGNVLVTADGRPLLADLGGARVMGSGAAVLGTRGFVAPEVLAGDAPTEASEVYALGALAWFCLTGSGAPETPIRLEPAEVAAAVGPELAACVASCIDPEPSRRLSPDRLAHEFFSAVPPEPIEVVVGGDEASALTHRIRLNAVAAPDEQRPARRHSTPTLASAARRLRRADGLLNRIGFPAAVLVALLAGGAAAWALLDPTGGVPPARSSPARTAGTLPASQPASQPAPAPTSRPPSLPPSRTAPNATPSSAPAPGVLAPASGEGVLTDVLAPRTSPTALLRELAERRADVLARRDRAALADVHLPRSASWAADVAVLDALERAGQRYSGLGVSAVSARPVSVTTAKAVVRGRVGLSAYVVVDATGGRSARPAATGQELDFSLVRTPAGWRIESVSEPAAT